MSVGDQNWWNHGWGEIHAVRCLHLCLTTVVGAKAWDGRIHLTTIADHDTHAGGTGETVDGYRTEATRPTAAAANTRDTTSATNASAFFMTLNDFDFTHLSPLLPNQTLDDTLFFTVTPCTRH